MIMRNPYEVKKDVVTCWAKGMVTRVDNIGGIQKISQVWSCDASGGNKKI